MIKKVLLTGATGFVGQVLIQKLRTENIAVTVLVRNKFTLPDIETITLDLTDDWKINPCIGVDTIFHLAGKAHALSEMSADDNEYRRINAEGTRHLEIRTSG